MDLVLKGNFTSFDTSSNEPVVVATSSHSSLIHNYHTNISHTLFTHRAKTVKFYPHGHSLLTTSDSEGLHIWDISRTAPIFTYKEDVKHHCFTNENLVIACASAIKLYDLRVRTCVGSISFSGDKVQCYGDRFICMGTRLCIGSWKSQEVGLYVNKTAENVAFNGGGYFYIVREGTKYWMSCNDGEYRIQCGSGVMCSVGDSVCVVDKCVAYLYADGSRRGIDIGNGVSDLICSDNALFCLYENGISRTCL